MRLAFQPIGPQNRLTRIGIGVSPASVAIRAFCQPPVEGECRVVLMAKNLGPGRIGGAVVVARIWMGGN